MKKRALISVYKKEGIVDFASELVTKYDYEIISTGGTAKLLKENNVPVVEVSEITKFPEMLDGRVKTLHPAIHGGLLARRDKKEHLESISKQDIKPIDIVVINLYPFEEVVSKPSASFEDAIENIDIGGPAMIRSAAKNHKSVAVISDSADLKSVLEDLEKNHGNVSEKLRSELALKAFERTSAYDNAISAYLSSFNKGVSHNGALKVFPKSLDLRLKLKQELRYGENPHQQAALYLLFDKSSGLANASVIQGKELSYNNYLDLESAWNIACEFDKKTPVAVVVKHNNPCGVAIAPDLFHAYVEAFNADPLSAFGGVVAFNETVSEDVAVEMTKVFLEAVIAPDYTESALEIFTKKPNLRVLKIKADLSDFNNLELRRIGGGYLVQDYNFETINMSDIKIATKRKPTEGEMVDLIFAWKVCKHVKSNAIVIAKEGRTLGVGAGQPNRVGSVEIAIKQASHDSRGAVLASDAFFPFKDSIDLASSAKIAAIIQPGGSKKDNEVIEACDKYGIAMVFTGMRHFKH
ncbi:MAG: bifunctional phosphoribosylaminoimidazolecarboxamide formyltransferase/IMP cyclohydrolase [Candidatus Melainabacteria bacterium]|nr:bifunctional phosphoribosylaminoimidazolecarboxamide formyltransferase/IMP cyclohydrolase [Candidatus Melainabacteria bacterium]